MRLHSMAVKVIGMVALTLLLGAPPLWATLTIKGPTKPVNANGSTVTLTVKFADDAGPTETLAVAVTSDPDGIISNLKGNGSTVKISKGKGTGKVSFKVSKNASSLTRTATVTVNGSPFTLNQSGQPCKVTIASPKASFAYAGGVGSFNVTAPAGCQWSATETLDWITVGTADGTGNDTVTYAVSENSGKNRSGKILVAGIDPVKHIPTAKKTHTVAQKGGNTVALSSAKAITAFSLAGVVGTINETGKTIAVTMPSGTSVTALVATFTTTGASVKVGSTVQISGTTANNFTSPVAYTVTAADASTQDYTVTVTVAVPTSANIWTQKADFGGVARYYAVGFAIGSKGYIGTGWVDPFTFFKDFWEYDPADDTWTQKADFGGAARCGAVGFSIGSKGYIGTGTTIEEKFSDFWEYDSAANTWTQKADFGGGERVNAIGFSIGSKGYIGTGIGVTGLTDKDFWEYDPATNTWTQKADFGGVGRQNAVGFSIGSKGYIGTGDDDGPSNSILFYKDFWEYVPGTNTWTQKADFGGTARRSPVGFSIGSKGYIGTGHVHVDNDYDYDYYKDFWAYDPGANTWTQKADFGGTERSLAVGFSIGSKGYIGTGWHTPFIYYKGFWEYEP